MSNNSTEIVSEYQVAKSRGEKQQNSLAVEQQLVFWIERSQLSANSRTLHVIIDSELSRNQRQDPKLLSPGELY